MDQLIRIVPGKVRVNDKNKIMGTYRPIDVTFEYGKGSYLYDYVGRSYLDFNAGIATLCLGHSHPSLVEAIKNQSERYWHCSNMYRVREAETLAERLCELTGQDEVFFTNSGVEAVECGLKIIRRYQKSRNGRSDKKIISIKNSFHGRSIAAISLTANPRYYDTFVLNEADGYESIEINAVEQLERLGKGDVGGVVLELVQGQGGLNVCDHSFIKSLAKKCKDNDVLLMIDEVHTGFFRTGTMFCYQQYEIQPDIICLSKGLGGGFPIGACLTKASASQYMNFGTHGSTLGGNALACSVALKVIDEIDKPDFKSHVNFMSIYLRNKLSELQASHPKSVLEVVGLGLMLGLRISLPRDAFVKECVMKGLLLGKSGRDVVKITPPLNTNAEEINKCVTVLKGVFSEHEAFCSSTKQKNCPEAL